MLNVKLDFWAKYVFGFSCKVQIMAQEMGDAHRAKQLGSSLSQAY